MSEKSTTVPDWAKRAVIDRGQYGESDARSVSDPNGFWGLNRPSGSTGSKPFTRSRNASFAPEYSINGSRRHPQRRLERIDRHLDKRANQTPIIWEGDDPSQSSTSPTASCTTKSAKMANILRTRNFWKGDRVTIYLPMIPEPPTHLAWRADRAIHSVVFAGFSPDSLASVSPTASPKSSSPPTNACAAAKKSAEGQMSIRRRQKRGVDWVVVSSAAVLPST